MSAATTGQAGGGSEQVRPEATNVHVKVMSGVFARNWWAVALRGVLGIIFGLTALVFPEITLLSLVLVFAAYMLADGLLAIVSAVQAAQKSERWSLLALEGLVSIATGAAVFFWPGITIFVFTIFIAAWAIVSGTLMFGSALRLSGEHGRWGLAAAGLLSTIFGFLLVIWPFIGAVVLTVWLGAYALVFGALLLVVGLRLRSRQSDTGGRSAVITDWDTRLTAHLLRRRRRI